MDIADAIRGAQERIAFLLSADRSVAELLEILRDTHRILAKLEATVDKLEAQTADLDAKRIDRLEEAVLNIERSTLGMDAAIHGLVGALPKSVQQRMRRGQGQPIY